MLKCEQCGDEQLADAVVEQIEDVLRACEWSVLDPIACNVHVCPLCTRSAKSGHHPSCPLAAALRVLETVARTGQLPEETP